MDYEEAEQQLPPHIQTLVDEVRVAFPSAVVGGDVDFPNGCFWMEAWPTEADEVLFRITGENPDWPLRYGVSRYEPPPGGVDLNTRQDEYFATFEQAKARFLHLMNAEEQRERTQPTRSNRLLHRTREQPSVVGALRERLSALWLRFSRW